MIHNRPQDIQKILSRKRLWDTFRWSYMNQPHRLFKATISCDCGACSRERLEKYKQHIKQRQLNKKIIQEQLMEP